MDYLHVFTYSERANTTAIRMEDIVPMEVRRERTKQLRILGSKLQRAHYERHMGTTRPVLFEAENVDGNMLGYTDNYIRATAPYDPSLTNTISSTQLDRMDGNSHMRTLGIEEPRTAISDRQLPTANFSTSLATANC